MSPPPVVEGCNCEHTRCEELHLHIAGSCPFPAIPEKRIVLLGAVCHACYERYPDADRVAHDEERAFEDALERWGSGTIMNGLRPVPVPDPYNSLVLAAHEGFAEHHPLEQLIVVDVDPSSKTVNVHMWRPAGAFTLDDVAALSASIKRRFMIDYAVKVHWRTP